ncbi:MAG: hypothetical protein WCC01_12610, partial [Acidimicrobiia bacterium]
MPTFMSPRLSIATAACWGSSRFWPPVGWLVGFGPVVRVGVEDTGSCGVGLARHHHREQIRVLMVARRSARMQRNQALNQLREIVICGPDEVPVRFGDR